MRKAGINCGQRISISTFVIFDEKTQLQALGRRHATLPLAPGRTGRFEFDYRRHGTFAYLAGWDVDHANLFDRVEAKTGIEPFGKLVQTVNAPLSRRQYHPATKRQRLRALRSPSHRSSVSRSSSLNCVMTAPNRR
jgi:hypothetical protein